MIRSTQKDLVSMLEKQGLKFIQFSLTHEGDYLPTDADWNYKDVPHLNLVHDLVDACYGMVGDDIIATINMQKIFGIRFPLTVFNYQSGPGRQTYFASFFVFQLIIETTYQQLGPLRTAVTTNYAIGSAPIWQLLAPLLKYVLNKNYENLMSADIPMRTRRGLLRKWGYSFKGDNSPYSFRNTMKIAEANLIAPEILAPLPENIRISLKDLASQKKMYIGVADHRGLRVQWTNQNEIQIFPRTCPHEGADLDDSPCTKNQISCPWHGRTFKPLASLSIQFDRKEAETDYFSIQLGADELIFLAKK